MDIWEWVFRTQRELHDAGHERLATLMNDLPGTVLDDANEQVEAMVPEALGLARSLSLPWVEIFLRHWQLQARGGGFAAVPDAVELLEFSHREEHKSCPQSVCTVQDLTIAYAGADGPGFVRERLDVSEETLARIDARWPCFQCISIERALTLLDADRAEDALAAMDEMRREITAAGGSPGEEAGVDAEALLQLGRPEDALERLDMLDRRDPERDSTFSRHRRLRRARALLALDRAPEADEALLPYEIALREPAYGLPWAQVAAGLADAGERENSWRLGGAIERLLAVQVERGRAWGGVRLAALHGRLALARGARETAAHALATGRELAELLRDPGRGAEVLAPLEDALAAAGEDAGDELPESAEALIEALGNEEDPDPELVAERLAAGARRWPDELALAQERAGALSAMGRDEAAQAVLWAFAEAHSDEPDAWSSAGIAAVGAGDGEAVERAASRLDGERPAYAAWVRGRWAIERGENAQAAALAEQGLAADPGSDGLRWMWLHAASETGDWAAVRDRVAELLPEAREEEAEGLRWSRLMAATALGDWATVRATAAEVGMELPEGDGPVDVDIAPVTLVFGPRDEVAAVRTGPVTARVVGIAREGEQRAGAVVLFDPFPLDEPEEDLPLRLRAREVLVPSAVDAYPFDAIDPGDDAWIAFRDRLHEEGWMLNSYVYPDEHGPDDGRTGLYGMLAVPEATDAAAAHARLRELAAGLPEPFFAPVLADAAGEAGAASAQRARATELGLLPD